MLDTLRKVTDLTENDLYGKRVLVRVDFNVPILDGEIENDFRIRKALSTISLLKTHGARVILLAHIEEEGVDSLSIIYEYLSRILNITFISDIYSPDVEEKISSLPQEGVVLFENLRKWSGEKENDPEFASHLASFGDLYVNDAFSVSHRSHASIVTLPTLLPSYAGLELMEEIQALSKAFDPERPFLFILGGAKFETKIPLVSKFLSKADHVALGGAIANAYLDARGFNVGTSLLPSSSLDIPHAEHEHLILPQDIITVGEWGKMPKNVEELNEDDNIQDIGPDTIMEIGNLAQSASMIVWNGPLGNYEDGFVASTHELAKILAASNAFTIVGGGDTLGALAELDLEDEFTFVSSGGGAMLEFLLSETLPGIEVLQS